MGTGKNEFTGSFELKHPLIRIFHENANKIRRQIHTHNIHIYIDGISLFNVHNNFSYIKYQ